MQADGYEQTDFESKPDQLQQKTAVFSTKKKPFPLIFKNNLCLLCLQLLRQLHLKWFFVYAVWFKS